MVGLQYWDDDASYNLVTGLLADELVSDITQAQAAHIPVFVGTAPMQLTSYFAVSKSGIEVHAIATKYNVPIINYSGAFSNWPDWLCWGDEWFRRHRSIVRGSWAHFFHPFHE
jgi:hypothetical protein